jgi:hypothetical protein
MSDDPVEEQLAAYNACDLERFLACYAPDAVIEDETNARLMVGHAAMQPAYAALFANSPNLHAEVTSRMRVGDFVVHEERVTGLPGREEPLHAVVVYRLREGLIIHARMFV